MTNKNARFILSSSISSSPIMMHARFIFRCVAEHFKKNSKSSMSTECANLTPRASISQLFRAFYRVVECSKYWFDDFRAFSKCNLDSKQFDDNGVIYRVAQLDRFQASIIFMLRYKKVIRSLILPSPYEHLIKRNRPRKMIDSQ